MRILIHGREIKILISEAFQHVRWTFVYSILYSFSRKYARERVYIASHSYLSFFYAAPHSFFPRKKIYKVMQYLEGIKYIFIYLLCVPSLGPYDRASSRRDDLSFLSSSFFFFPSSFYSNFITFLISSFDISAGALVQGVFIIVRRRYYRVREGGRWRRPSEQCSNFREIYSVARKPHPKANFLFWYVGHYKQNCMEGRPRSKVFFLIARRRGQREGDVWPKFILFSSTSVF